MRSVRSTLYLRSIRNNKGGNLMDWYGYTGNILNVDLAEDKISIVNEKVNDLKNFIGGEIKTYTDMANNARDESFNRMVNQAIDLNADAIIGMKFMTSMIMQGASEMLAYGTAVKLN